MELPATFRRLYKSYETLTSPFRPTLLNRAC